MPALRKCDTLRKTGPGNDTSGTHLRVIHYGCHTRLVIHVDKVVIQVERKLQTIGKLYLYIAAVTVDGMYLHSGEIAVDIRHDLLGHYACGDY